MALEHWATQTELGIQASFAVDILMEKAAIITQMET